MNVVFLDRDGVINEFPGNGNYVTKVKDFHFIPGAIEAIRALTEAGCKIFIISNQAGVGKGIYSRDKLNLITSHMLKHITQKGGRIKKVFYCTHRSDQGCDCRKPKIGLVRKALQSLNKTIRHAQKAYFIGDTKVDILAGHNAGCKTIFVLSGREDHQYMRRKWPIRPDYIAKDLWEATNIITQNGNTYPTRLRRSGSQARR